MEDGQAKVWMSLYICRLCSTASSGTAFSCLPCRIPVGPETWEKEISQSVTLLNKHLQEPHLADRLACSLHSTPIKNFFQNATETTPTETLQGRIGWSFDVIWDGQK